METLEEEHSQLQRRIEFLELENKQLWVALASAEEYYEMLEKMMERAIGVERGVLKAIRTAPAEPTGD